MEPLTDLKYFMSRVIADAEKVKELSDNQDFVTGVLYGYQTIQTYLRAVEPLYEKLKRLEEYDQE